MGSDLVCSIVQLHSQSDQVCHWVGQTRDKLVNATILNLPHDTTSDEEVNKLTRFFSFPSLTYLNLSMCNISDKALEDIAGIYTKLQALDVSHCKQISHKGLRLVLEKCKDLRDLSLVGCEQIDEKDLTDIRWEDTKVETLDIGYCDKMTFPGIKKIVSRCSYLHSMRLDDLPINDQELKTLLQTRSLKKVDLSYCKNITSKGIRKLQKEYPEVDFRHTLKGKSHSGCVIL